MPSKARKSKLYNSSKSVADEIRRQSPIKIGHKFFLVQVFSAEDWPCEEKHIGCIHFFEGEIHLKEDILCPFEMVDSLFHECLHGIYSLFLDHNKRTTSRSSEERWVSAGEVGLITLFVDNPRLLSLFAKYWTGAKRQPQGTKRSG